MNSYLHSTYHRIDNIKVIIIIREGNGIDRQITDCKIGLFLWKKSKNDLKICLKMDIGHGRNDKVRCVLANNSWNTQRINTVWNSLNKVTNEIELKKNSLFKMQITCLPKIDREIQ